MKKLFHLRWLVFVVIISVSFSLPVLPSQVQADGPAPDDFPLAEQSILTLPNMALGNGDLADVHFPGIPTELREVFTETFPIVVFLQGANVDKAQYQSFGRQIARRGFVVVVANHFRTVPPLPVPGLFTATSVITSALTLMQQEDADPNSPLHSIVDTNTMGLVGHSLTRVGHIPPDTSFLTTSVHPALAPAPFPAIHGRAT